MQKHDDVHYVHYLGHFKEERGDTGGWNVKLGDEFAEELKTQQRIGDVLVETLVDNL